MNRLPDIEERKFLESRGGKIFTRVMGIFVIFLLFCAATTIILDVTGVWDIDWSGSHTRDTEMLR